MTQTGCAFLGGAAVGALGTGAGYEINNKRQMDGSKTIIGTSGYPDVNTKNEKSRSKQVRSSIN